MTTNEQPENSRQSVLNPDIRSLTEKIQNTHAIESEKLKKKVDQAVESIHKSKNKDAEKVQPSSQPLDLLGSM